MQKYTSNLPEGYRETDRISFSDAPTGLLPDLKVLWPGLLLIFLSLLRTHLTFGQAAFSLLLFAGSIYPYFFLHELLHALVYKVATGQPVRIRFHKTGASCALPEGYISHQTATLCTAAPLTVLGILLTLSALCPHWFSFPSALLLSFHLLGCRSDVYLLRQLKKYSTPEALVQDLGTEQRIYMK